MAHGLGERRSRIDGCSRDGRSSEAGVKLGLGAPPEDGMDSSDGDFSY